MAGDVFVEHAVVIAVSCAAHGFEGAGLGIEFDGVVLVGDAERGCFAGDAQASVKVSVEISAEFPAGVSDQVKRAVSENAASLGGISGHAGLFSTAAEVALLGQLYLRQGKWNNRHLLSSETVAAMTMEQTALDGQRRGLAWVLWTPQNCTCGGAFGPRSFGHTGFTGTSLWVDPERDLLVVALTNRVYHGRDPAAISQFRPRLHDLVVNALQAIE